MHRALRLDIPKAAVSQHLAVVLQGLGVPDGRITVVPNGLDHEIYRPPTQHATRKNSIAVLGVEPAPPKLPAWVRYFHGLHGPELVRRVYQTSAVYLCGSVSEGWGFPVAEAMACGAAVVSTRNGGVEDFCVHKENALLVNVGDVDAMADAVTTLLLDENLRAELVDSAARTAATMDWSASTDMFRDALAVPARR